MASNGGDGGDASDISGRDKMILSRIFNPGLPSSDVNEETEQPDLSESKKIEFTFC